MIRKIVFLLILSFISIFSQDPSWSSALIIKSNPSPYISDWERNPEIGTLLLNYVGTAPVQFYQEVIFTIDGYGEAIRGRTESREFISGPISEVLAFNIFFKWKEATYKEDLERLIFQTGTLPKSSYTICVTTYSIDGTLLTVACTDFDITLPTIFTLSQNYPNPFNPTTKIAYSIPSNGFKVNLSVYNVLGEEVSILVNSVQNAGNYEVEFDGSSLSSGAYLYRLSAGSFVQTSKMILLR